MKRFSLKTMSAVVAIVAMAGMLTTAQAFEPKVVTFDNGTEGWTANPDCETILNDGADHGNYWNFVNRECEGSYVLRAWFKTWNDNDPAFIGDYTVKGPVRISVDVNVNDYTYYWFNSWVEESRQLVIEFVDYDNPYTDPETGYSWPWTSVIYPMGYFPSRLESWETFIVDIADPSATEVPEGWVGYGGPEDPNTYMPQLPPGRTFADVMAEVDEVQLHSIEPGYFYSIGFLHDIDFDNITIRELPRECDGREATVYVDNDGIVRGGEFDGMPYAGELTGTMGDDVIVGTDGDDTIQGLGGDDLICGLAGNDALHGHFGNDFVLGGEGDDNLTGQRGKDYLDGGPGRDTINGGADSDTCINGEVVTQCGQVNGNSGPQAVNPDSGLRLDSSSKTRSFSRN